MPRKKKEDASLAPRLVVPRKARGLTPVQLAEATKTTQRSISYYENDDGVPPSSVTGLEQALQVSELLVLKPPPKAAPAVSDGYPETRRHWKRFQVVTQLPEKDQRAVIRLINSLAAVAAPRRNGSPGEHRNGH